jgi:hypothetical protein
VAGPQYIPSRGDRIEQTRLGIRRTGTVWYADQLQLLVKWDEGGSSSLRLGAAGVRVLEHDGTPAAAKVSEVARLRVSDPELVPELIAFLHTHAKESLLQDVAAHDHATRSPGSGARHEQASSERP